MWMLPLYLHANQKSVVDDEDDDDARQVGNILLWRFDHEIFSMVILSC